MGGVNLPILVASGIAVIWFALIFFGVESLYRRGSPLYIIYWGSWICFFLWYERWRIDQGIDKRHALIVTILAVAIVLGLLFAAFGQNKEGRRRQ